MDKKSLTEPEFAISQLEGESALLISCLMPHQVTDLMSLRNPVAVINT